MKKTRNYYDEIKMRSVHDQKQLYVDAMFIPANGYGDLAKHLCIEAAKKIDLGIIPFGDFTNEIRGFGLEQNICRIPNPNSLLSIQPMFTMRKNIANHGAVFTMFEATKLASAWVKTMNTFKVAITPSHANAVSFLEQLQIPVEVANMGHDPYVYNYQPYPASEPFVFGAAAHVGHGRVRKGVERIIEWFESAFPNQKNVRLSLKLNAWPQNGIIPTDPRIEVIEKDLSDTGCLDWLRSLHCYIDGSTFEGWGMWNHHAMATGRPVIGTNYSARCEYFRFGNHIPIGYKLTPASDQYIGLGHWAMPSDSDAIEAMRWAYANPDQCEEIGKKAHQTVEPMTWKRFAKRVLRILHKYGIARSK